MCKSSSALPKYPAKSEAIKSNLRISQKQKEAQILSSSNMIAYVWITVSQLQKTMPPKLRANVIERDKVFCILYFN
jgi:hypothetical protein